MSAQAPAAAAAPAPAKSKKLIWIVLITVLIGAAGGGGYWWSMKQSTGHGAAKPAKPAKAPAQYYALEPAFVVNLADMDQVRYLQADVQLMTRDPETLAALQANAPAVRNRLLLLFSQQQATQLTQRSGKERLQEKALTEVVALLKAEGAPSRVEGVIFTSLVTQ